MFSSWFVMVKSKWRLSDGDRCADSSNDWGMVRGEIIAGLKISIYRRNSVSYKEIQKIRDFIGVRGPVSWRTSGKKGVVVFL